MAVPQVPHVSRARDVGRVIRSGDLTRPRGFLPKVLIVQTLRGILGLFRLEHFQLGHGRLPRNEGRELTHPAQAESSHSLAVAEG